MNGFDHVVGIKALDTNNVGVPTLLMHSHDRILPRLAASWQQVARRLTNPGLLEEIPDGLPATERTRYLWATIEPEPGPVWAEAAGLPWAVHVERAMFVLLDNSAIFPDGTLSDWTMRYLKAEGQKQGIKMEADEAAAV